MAASAIGECEITLTVRGPIGGPRVWSFSCDADGSQERLKSMGYEWWRQPLVARCRREWGDGTLVPDGEHAYRWQSS